MACTSLVALPRACGASGIVAGIETLYIISFADLVPGDDGNPYTLADNGMVATITPNSYGSKHFVEIGLLKSSAGLNETLTKDLTKGTAYFTQTLTVVLSDLTVENQTFIGSVLRQPVAIIVRSRTGNYFAAGLNGLLELATMVGGTGIAEGDLMGYTLTFNGIDVNLVPSVDPTIIAGLIA